MISETMYSSKAGALFRRIAKVNLCVDGWSLEDKIFDGAAR